MTNNAGAVIVGLVLACCIPGCGKKAPEPAAHGDAPSSGAAPAVKAPGPEFTKDVADDLKDVTQDLAGTQKELTAEVMGVSKETVRLRAEADLERRIEKWEVQVNDTFARWEQDAKLRSIRDEAGGTAGTAYQTAEKALRGRRDALIKSGADRLKAANDSVQKKLKAAADAKGLTKVEKVEFPVIREEFQKRLDADLAAYEGEVEAARGRVTASAKEPAKDGSTARLNDDVLQQVRKLKEDATECPVVWDRNVELQPDTRITRIYLTKLYRAGLVKDLPQDALVKVIDASLRTPDEFVRKSGLELCGKIDDAVVFRRLATKEALRAPEFRKVVLVRLPALVAASGSNSTGEGAKLLEALADAYVADPQPGHAGEFDKAVKQITDGKARKTKEFVWFLAAAAWSGSPEADRELFELYTTEWRDYQTVSHRYDAGRRAKFNYLVGALAARRAGKDASAVFPRCVTAIVPGVNEERLLALRDFSAIRGVQDLNDFMCGWFAAVDASFAPEALRVYRLVFEDPERKKLKGMEALLGGFESFRLGAISLALRTPEGLPVEFLYQVNKLHWQSERVVALATLKETGRIEKVQTDALKGMVDDPWAGTARYPTGLLRRPNRQVHIDEWMFYGQMLEERSKDAAADAYLRAFLGQTAIRTSGQGEAAMYPYRVHALRRVVALKPDVLPDLVQFAAGEKCPVALRRAVLCAYAADHDRIGKQHLEKIPAAMPRDGLSPLSSWYVDGMLKGFDAVRTGKESPAIKSAEEDAVRGYADVLLSYDRPELTRLAVAALKYENIEPKLPGADVAVDSAGSEITPFHFMTRDALLASAKRLKGGERGERVVDEYGKWAAKVWPSPDAANVPKNAEEARKGFVAEHRLLETRPGRDVAGEVLRAFHADPSRENAQRIATDWPLYEPEVVARALKVLMSDKDALDRVADFASSVATGSPSSGRAFDRAPNSCVLIQQRAEVLEAVFADVRAFEGAVTDKNQRRSLDLRVVQPIKQFLDEGPRAIAKCREAAK